MEKIGFGPRLIAALIDGVIVFVVNAIIGFVFGMLGDSGVMLGSVVGFAFGLGYYIYFWSSTGQTPGKKVMGIKIVPVDGGSMTVGKAVMRYVGYLVSSFVLLLGFIWILFDTNKQGWHDKIAGTYVVKA